VSGRFDPELIVGELWIGDHPIAIRVLSHKFASFARARIRSV
jgi:hypothetical protein